MAWPFTPITTFLSKSVPKVTASFLNSVQSAINAASASTYQRRLTIQSHSTNGTQVLVYPPAVYIKDSATGLYTYIDGGVGYTVTATWPTSAWRYLYMVSTNGVASIEVSSTAPAVSVASPFFKAGDETRRYLCSVYCGAGATVIPFQMLDGRYRYLGEQAVLTGAVGTGAWGALSLAAFVPPQTQRVELMARITNASGAIGGLAFRAFSAAGIQLNADANSFDERSLLMSSGGNSIDWIAPATTTADVIVLGWEE